MRLAKNGDEWKRWRGFHQAVDGVNYDDDKDVIYVCCIGLNLTDIFNIKSTIILKNKFFKHQIMLYSLYFRSFLIE